MIGPSYLVVARAHALAAPGDALIGAVASVVHPAADLSIEPGPAS